MVNSLEVVDENLETAGSFLDEEACLDFDNWKDVAEKIAEKEGIALTDRHWEVVNIVREYYEENGISLREADGYMVLTGRLTDGGARYRRTDIPKVMKEVNNLFPPSKPFKVIRKLAGVTDPVDCV